MWFKKLMNKLFDWKYVYLYTNSDLKIVRAIPFDLGFMANYHGILSDTWSILNPDFTCEGISYVKKWKPCIGWKHYNFDKSFETVRKRG